MRGAASEPSMTIQSDRESNSAAAAYATLYERDAEIARLTALLSELREALRPFAERAADFGNVDLYNRDNGIITTGAELVFDCRRAAAVLRRGE